MALMSEAQTRFLDALERFERAAGELLQKQMSGQQVFEQLRALRAEHAALAAENRALRAQNSAISARLEQAISGLRETLGN